MKMFKIFKDQIPPLNLAHVATLKTDIQTLARDLNAELISDVDDLDHFSSLNLCLEDEFFFCLYKYQNRPSGTVELYFESQRPDWENRFRQISAALQLGDEQILWLNKNYLKTP